jgi:hypothetical protein
MQSYIGVRQGKNRAMLEETAVASLAHWSYPADFGLHGDPHLNYNGVWDEVVVRFNLCLPDPETAATSRPAARFSVCE